MPWDKKWFQFAVIVLLAFIWGSSFILMKVGLKSFSSMQAASIRIAMASLVLSPLTIHHIKAIQKKDVKSLLIAGFVGSFIPAFLFTKAQTRIDSAIAGMLNSLTPVFTLIVGAIIYKAKTGKLQVVGLLFGLLGASGLILSGSGFNLGHTNSFALLIVLATTCYAFNINEVKNRLTHLSGIQITSLSFMFIGPVALFYLLTTDFKPVLASENWSLHFLALATLGVIGTAATMLVMNTLIRYTSAVFASSVTYIIPMFAIMWGLIDGERITIVHVLCMAVILLGVFLSNKK